MKFMVNNLKTEIDYQKKMFSVAKLQQLDGYEQKFRNLSYEVQVAKMNMDSFANKTELDKLGLKLQDYATLKSI